MSSLAHHISVDTLDDLAAAASQILHATGNKKIILLHGDLGAGKTTLTQHLVSILGYARGCSSPTYSLINEYESPSAPIYHIDLYRLNDLDEAIEIGIEDYLYSGHYCFIEWPNLIIPLLKDEYYITVNIAKREGQRRVITVKT